MRFGAYSPSFHIDVGDGISVWLRLPLVHRDNSEIEQSETLLLRLLSEESQLFGPRAQTGRRSLSPDAHLHLVSLLRI
jgi:hypothetical protein